MCSESRLPKLRGKDVRIGDPDKNGKSYPILANANIPPNHVRMLDVTDQINDPKQNVIDQSFSGSTGLLMAYGQSFLREELGKMYRGELVLRGIPEIEPMDVLLIMDPSTGMMGPIEVETVTHVLNNEDGFITLIKPRAVVAVNEAASANFLRMLMKTRCFRPAEPKQTRARTRRGLLPALRAKDQIQLAHHKTMMGFLRMFCLASMSCCRTICAWSHGAPGPFLPAGRTQARAHAAGTVDQTLTQEAARTMKRAAARSRNLLRSGLQNSLFAISGFAIKNVSETEGNLCFPTLS
jgi:hypothetical protein